MRYSTNYPKEDLNGDWKLIFSNNNDLPTLNTIKEIESSGLRSIDAAVPGNFELSLMQAGLLPDLYFGFNILETQKYENCDIWYYRHFTSTPLEDAEPVIIFDGLDCFADIFLNGILVGSCDNMLVEHEIPLKDILKKENEIVVHIKSAIKGAQKYPYPPLVSAYQINYEGLYVRKAPHMYGWDITPRVLSAGIWRNVSLVNYPKQKLKDVFLQTINISEDKKAARLRLSYNSDIVDIKNGSWEILINGKCRDSDFNERKSIYFSAGQVTFNIDQPLLWWSKGRGDPNLYQVTVRLEHDGLPVDEITFTFGIRTIRLDRKSVPGNEKDCEFCFVVNDEKVFIKGTNWVPMDIFHSKDRDRIKQVFPLLDDIGCNMVRCWGGNVYEDDLFFDLCDQHGILVWQDFAMACAVYPQDAKFQQSLEVEAQKVTKRLRQHPCLALWAGDNECDETYLFEPKMNPNENILTRSVLPSIIRQEDPLRPYLQSSPYFDQQSYEFGGRFLVEDHLWGPRDYYKSDFYNHAFCHFVSEIGYHGCPSVNSIKQFISPPNLWPYTDNPEWELHSTAPVPGCGLYTYRINLMANQIAEMFQHIPEELEDFSFASQVTQAEALKYFIEMFRYNKWRKSGIIWWNLIDGWPQFSDAVVDYFLQKKLAYEYIKTSQQDICLMLKEPDNWKQELVVVNDTNHNVEISYEVEEINSGKIEIRGKRSVGADVVTSLGEFPSIRSKQSFYLIHWKLEGKDYSNHYLKGNPPFDLRKYKQWLNEYQKHLPSLANYF
jgi:beta-mannosidase